MKKLLFWLAAAALPLAAVAQSSSSSLQGHLQYEVAQKIDLSQMRIVINGQQVKPGSPDFPTDIPDVRTFGLTLAYAGNYAKEEREGGTATRVMVDGGPGGRGAGVPQTTKINAPFQEVTYLNLAAHAYTTVLTVKDGDKSTSYRAEQPFKKPEGWKEAEQTKKIAGYLCHKATAPFKGETYTIWYTTELPLTYSPVKELTPEKGVVLALEAEKEQYKATKVDAKPVAEADVKPAAGAQTVTPEELADKRDRAKAEFRRKMMEEGPGQGPGQGPGRE